MYKYSEWEFRLNLNMLDEYDEYEYHFGNLFYLEKNTFQGLQVYFCCIKWKYFEISACFHEWSHE